MGSSGAGVVLLTLSLLLQPTSQFWLFNVLFPPTNTPEAPPTNSTPPVVLGKVSTRGTGGHPSCQRVADEVGVPDCQQLGGSVALCILELEPPKQGTHSSQVPSHPWGWGCRADHVQPELGGQAGQKAGGASGISQMAQRVFYCLLGSGGALLAEGRCLPLPTAAAAGAVGQHPPPLDPPKPTPSRVFCHSLVTVKALSAAAEGHPSHVPPNVLPARGMV